MTATDLMEDLMRLPMLKKLIFQDFDRSTLNLPINQTQEHVLMVIGRHPDSTMSEISRRMGLEKGSFTTITDHLLTLKLIERNHSEKDRRRITLKLTPEGDALALRVHEAREAHLRSKLDSLSSIEQEELASALKTISGYAERLLKGY